MKTNTTYFIVIAAILSIAGMYFLLPTKHIATMDVAAMGDKDQKPTYSLSTYQKDFEAKQHDSIKAVIQRNVAKLNQASDSLTKIAAYSELIKMYNGFHSPELAAYYSFEKAQLIQNAKSWELCGDNFLAVLKDPSTDTMLYTDIMVKATNSYESSVGLDTLNIDAKIKLAQCYMEFKNQPMQGVQMLLSIVRKDSMNIPANLLLAKFGLMSGQYEKVLPRLKKVLSLQPNNVEALLLNADANTQIGKIDIAIANLQTLIGQKNLAPQMKIEIRAAIEELKKKQH